MVLDLLEASIRDRAEEHHLRCLGQGLGFAYPSLERRRHRVHKIPESHGPNAVQRLALDARRNGIDEGAEGVNSVQLLRGEEVGIGLREVSLQRGLQVRTDRVHHFVKVGHCPVPPLNVLASQGAVSGFVHGGGN